MTDHPRGVPPTPDDPVASPERPLPAPPPGVRTMSIVRWVLVLLTAVIATASISSYVRGRSTERGAGGQHLYYCPMHPAVVQDHPGECPICGMNLVPKPEGKPKSAGPTSRGAAGDAGTPPTGETAPVGVPGLGPVDLTSDRVQLIGMRTAPVTREALGGELRAVGVVTANERGLSQVTTRFAGWIQTLAASTTGERVRRGQVLATVYSPEVLRAQQELLVAHGWTTPAAGATPPEPALDGLAASARQRLELLGISPREIDDLLRTGKVTEAIALRSPVDGFVVAKSAVVGLAIQPGTVLFQVADLSTVWVTADIYEMDVARIRVGQRARLELAAYPGESHTGKVAFVSPALDGQSRTLSIRLEFKNRFDRSGPRLRPGMSGTVFLALPATTGLMVPAEAIVDTGELQYLFVARQAGRFEPRRVKLGARAGGKVEVLSGVTAGETVVTTGNFLVDSESRLRAAIEGAPAPR